MINSKTLPPFPKNLLVPSAFWSPFLLSLGAKKQLSEFYFHGCWDAQAADVSGGAGWEIFEGRSSLAADSARTHQ